jgi:hypothetical protein
MSTMAHWREPVTGESSSPLGYNPALLPSEKEVDAFLARTTLDPLRLVDEIRMIQAHLAEIAAGRVVHALPHRDADLEGFLKSLAVAWKDGRAQSNASHASQTPTQLAHWSRSI